MAGACNGALAADSRGAAPTLVGIRAATGGGVQHDRRSAAAVVDGRITDMAPVFQEA